MNRVLQITAAAVIAFLIQPGFAQQPADATEDAQPALAAPQPQEVDEQFAKMQEQMAKMQAQMDKIRQAKECRNGNASSRSTDHGRGGGDDGVGRLPEPHTRTAQAAPVHDGPVDADASDDDGSDDAAPTLDDAATATPPNDVSPGAPRRSGNRRSRSTGPGGSLPAVRCRKRGRGQGGPAATAMQDR